MQTFCHPVGMLKIANGHSDCNCKVRIKYKITDRSRCAHKPWRNHPWRNHVTPDPETRIRHREYLQEYHLWQCHYLKTKRDKSKAKGQLSLLLTPHSPEEIWTKLVGGLLNSVPGIQHLLMTRCDESNTIIWLADLEGIWWNGRKHCWQSQHKIWPWSKPEVLVWMAMRGRLWVKHPKWPIIRAASLSSSTGIASL